MVVRFRIRVARLARRHRFLRWSLWRAAPTPAATTTTTAFDFTTTTTRSSTAATTAPTPAASAAPIGRLGGTRRRIRWNVRRHDRTIACDSHAAVILSIRVHPVWVPLIDCDAIHLPNG